MGDWNLLDALCVHQSLSEAEDFTAPAEQELVWLVTPPLPPSPPMYQWHRWPNLKAPLEATQQGQVITVVPFKESSSPRRLPLSTDQPLPSRFSCPLCIFTDS